ncbi:MAG: hypothetical protein U0R68_11755 [Candidatus Nanopelagicales bacterium]
MSESYGEPRAGQEAARLLAAAQDWLRTSAPHVAPLDAEGRTCACPLCRAVAGVRDADPDAVGRWVDSAVAAATAALAQASEMLVTPPEQGASEADDADLVDVDVDDDLLADLDELEGEELDATGAAEAARDEDEARQDEDRARGVRRIPIVQQEPGDLDG